MDNLFSDLVPNAGGSVSSGLFSDLIPADSAQPDGSFVDSVPGGRTVTETLKGIPEGAVAVGGSALKGAAGVQKAGQHNAAASGQRQLEVMDRIDRGEVVPATEDPLGYQDMSPEQRTAARADLVQAQAAFDPGTVADSRLYQAGQGVEDFSRTILPAQPGYEDSTARNIGRGIGSVAGGVATSVAGGPLAAGATFALAGSGEAVSRAVQNGASEDEVISAAKQGLIPGLTDSLPVETLLGRVPLPGGQFVKIPVGMLGDALKAGQRIGFQALIEGIQEGGQEFLQNVIQRQYDEDAKLIEGVPEGAGIGAAVGGIVETALTPARSRGARSPQAQAQPQASAFDDLVPQGATPAEQVMGADLERADSPRLTQEDRSSPLPNDLIDDGKAMIEQALSGAPPAQLNQDGGPDVAAPTPQADLVTQRFTARASLAENIAGREVVFPDEAHARLYRLGAAIDRGDRPDPQEVQGLLSEFRGFVVEDPDYGVRFQNWRHVGELATEYSRRIGEDAQAGSGRMVASDALSDDDARVRWINRQSSDAAPAAPSRLPEPVSAPAAAQPVGSAGVARRDLEGGVDTAVTASGRSVPVQYAVVEASSLVPSQRDEGGANPDYPAELQPRDRDRLTSQTQIQSIASNINPRLLDKTPRASDGAPIIAPDGVVESGNGRVLALRKAYADGKAEGYRSYLTEQGYPVEGMEQPVLVRVRSGEMAPQDRQAFTREANERDTLAMSATEQAMADAQAMSPDLLSLYRGGDVDEAGNRDFVRGFIGSVVGQNDQARMIGPDGALSQEAVRRVQAGLLGKAYSDPDLVAALVESTDTNIKAIGGAAMDVAPAWAQMRDEAASGRISPDADQTQKFLEAVRLVERARKEGKKLGDLVGQRDIFSGQAIDPTTELFLRLMFRNQTSWTMPAGREKLAEALRFYIEEMRKTSAGADLLGEMAPGPEQVLALAKEKQYGRQPAQDSLALGSSVDPGAREDVRASGGGRAVKAERGRDAQGGAEGARAGDKPAGEVGSLSLRDPSLGAFRVRQTTGNIEVEFVLTEDFVGKAQQLSARLRKELDGLGLKDVGLRVSQSISAIIGGERFAADGQYFRNLIDIALDAKNPDATLGHEAIHALRKLNLFTETEWAVLSRKSKNEWLERYNIPDTYAGFPEWAQIEEGVAHAYASWVEGKKTDGLLARSFKRIKAAVESLGNVLRGLGFASSDKIFERVSGGEVGGRPRDAFGRFASSDPMFQTAWHGTPHEFERFTIDRIGSGEGNQAYGWGLYFAGEREVAEHYRKSVTTEQGARKSAAAILAVTGSEDIVRRRLQQFYPDITEKEATDALRFAKGNRGRLYRVDLPEDSELLLWDEPLNKQPAGLKEKFLDVIERFEPHHRRRMEMWSPPSWTDIPEGTKYEDAIAVGTIYSAAAGHANSERAVSEALREAGIPGHRYLDRFSRNNAEGSYNYVIYDDARIAIEARFALRTEPETAAERQQVTQGFLNRGQPVDRALRLPFQIFGGLDAEGQWKPGKYLSDRASHVITEAKINPGGRFGWLAGPLEAARAGLIDRYGLDPAYVDRERQRAMDERKILLQGTEVLKSLKDQNVSVDEARVLQAVLTGEAVDDAAMKKLALPVRQAIDEMGQEAVALGLLSAESYERNRGAYLHRVYARHEAEQSGLAKMVGRMMGASRKKIVGDQFKGRGMFFEVDLERLTKADPEWREAQRGRPQKGEKFRLLERAQEDMLGGKAKPVERVFWPTDRAVPDRYSDLRERGTWEIRGEKGGKFVLWRDYTKDERASMGEILDARYTIGKTYLMMAHDLATGRFYKDIAGNEEWTRTSEPAEGTWTDPQRAGRYTGQGEFLWVRVPDTNIPKSGGKKKWGALSGKWVRSEIWRDLNEIEVMSQPTTWRLLLTQWKLNKTARSPVVHMNNVMSNVMFMDLADVRMQDLAAGLRAYTKGDRNYQEAAANGAFGSDMMSQEIRDNVLKPILDEITADMQAGVSNSFFARAKALGRMADRIWSWAKTADQKMIDAYRIEDEVFRMATYMRRRSLGDDPKAAANFARAQFLDYDIRAPWVNAARNSLLPFISYTYRAVPVIARAIATRPWKLPKYFLVSYMANALAYAWDDDGDEEKERASLRDEERGWTWLGTPRMLRMPYRNDDGLPVFLDIRRWVPAGDVFDTNQGSSAVPIPAPLQFGGPLMIAAEMALNKQGFTGDEITNRETDNWLEQTSKTGDYLWKSWMPSAAWVPGSWYWQKIGNAAKGATDASGRPYDMTSAVASSVGIKLKPQDVEQGLYWQGYELRKIERELRAQARRLGRQRERNLISQREYDKGIEGIVGKLGRLGDRATELQDAADGE